MWSSFINYLFCYLFVPLFGSSLLVCSPSFISPSFQLFIFSKPVHAQLWCSCLSVASWDKSTPDCLQFSSVVILQFVRFSFHNYFQWCYSNVFHIKHALHGFCNQTHWHIQVHTHPTGREPTQRKRCPRQFVWTERRSDLGPWEEEWGARANKSLSGVKETLKKI